MTSTRTAHPRSSRTRLAMAVALAATIGAVPVVAQDGTNSGSYGTDGTGQERPEDVSSLDCPLPQSLGDRCD